MYVHHCIHTVVYILHNGFHSTYTVAYNNNIIAHICRVSHILYAQRDTHTHHICTIRWVNTCVFRMLAGCYIPKSSCVIWSPHVEVWSNAKGRRRRSRSRETAVRTVEKKYRVWRRRGISLWGTRDKCDDNSLYVCVWPRAVLTRARSPERTSDGNGHRCVIVLPQTLIHFKITAFSVHISVILFRCDDLDRSAWTTTN